MASPSSTGFASAGIFYMLFKKGKASARWRSHRLLYLFKPLFKPGKSFFKLPF
jgi:hypothetical protein